MILENIIPQFLYNSYTILIQLLRQNIEVLDDQYLFTNRMHHFQKFFVQQLVEQIDIPSDFVKYYKFHFLNTSSEKTLGNNKDNVIQLLNIILKNYIAGLSNLLFKHKDTMILIKDLFFNSKLEEIYRFIFLLHEEFMLENIFPKLKCHNFKGLSVKNICLGIGQKLVYVSNSNKKLHKIKLFCEKCYDKLIFDNSQLDNGRRLEINKIDLHEISDNGNVLQDILISFNIENHVKS